MTQSERLRELPLFPDIEMALEPFLETVNDLLAEAQFDRQTHIVCNVALLGPASCNGYRYTVEAMQEALPLYDGRPVFVDHAEAVSGASLCGQLAPRVDTDSRSASATLPQRSLRDYAGKVMNPRFENDRIRGDLHLIGPNAEWLLALFEASPSDIGMSHVVLARRNPAGDEVAKIEKVVSVDIVAFPATVHSFRESSQLAPRVDGTGISIPPFSHAAEPGSPCLSLTGQLAPRVDGTGSSIPPFSHAPACGASLPCSSLVGQLAERVDYIAETPRSAERDGRLSPAALRRALIAAIRGEP